ncbi:TraR/DksA family transcriptional regulator [Thermomonas sp.]|uniref:TraR/DksA family transcriptional regulator n=1 Tax=Thermomonas sp. TaxID=1971895 RepID=UPI001AD2CA2D|nr:TraR/DksA C4-type zinc finger protein [Xanthomonadales bacterium]MBN8768088.1 TraR/DksA C4-type zinc finger protein [Stenotrophomonas sp.]
MADSRVAPEWQALHARLLTLREQLLAIAEASAVAGQTVEFDQASVGRLSRMDALQGQQMALATEQRRQRQLQQIAVALRRMEQGEYGDCLACGAPIDPRRLEADPLATHCIGCADRPAR